jgi:hypothetical protein
MKSYAVLYNNNIIGIYSNKEDLDIFIKSCIQNGFIKDIFNILIKSFITNSCCFVEDIKIDNNNNNIKREDYSYYNIESMDKNNIVSLDENNIESMDKNNIESMDKNNIVSLDENNIESMDKNNIESMDKNNIVSLDENKEYQEYAKKQIENQHKINMIKKQKELLKEKTEIYKNDLNLFDRFSEMKINDSTFIIPELFIDKYNIIKKLKENNNLSFDNFNKEYNLLNSKSNNYDEFKSNSYEDKFESDILEEFEL